MAKRKRTAKEAKDIESRPKPKEPQATPLAFQIALWTIGIGLIVQLIIAVLVYPTLPSLIPSGFYGSAMPHNWSPSWLIFIMFPGAHVVMLVITAFSPKNDDGKRVMTTGNAGTLVLLALLFTALQASAFHLPRN